eukprot:c5318_g1_i2.p2 GENE.c5318_g1_i2~~c5318_g1_i2.p2  ORF type:complete len:145 (+),score=40.90 c5318_g1_i2:493-927(+)
MRLRSRPEIQQVDEMEDPTTPIKPSIIKKDRTVMYEFLQTPNVPCNLDYMEVLFTLCELFVLVYRKFVDPSSANVHVHDAILRIDDRIKHHIITTISMDLSRVASAIAQQESSKVDPMLGAFVTSATRGLGVKEMLAMLTGSGQ